MTAGDPRVRPLTRDDFMHVKTCCTSLCDLIPGMENDMNSGKLVGMLAFEDDICAGAIVGMLDVEGTMEDKFVSLPHVRILFVEVSHRFRGHGIGNLLMERYMQELRTHDIAAVTVSLYKSYQDRSGFFERHGFERTRTERNMIVLKKSLWSDYGVIDVDDEELD